MLNGIHLVNFGNHSDTKIAFGRFNALVGQNGAGKSTILRAIQAFRDLQETSPPQGDLLNARGRTWPTWYVRAGETESTVAIGQHGNVNNIATVWGAVIDFKLQPGDGDAGRICVSDVEYKWRKNVATEKALHWFPSALSNRRADPKAASEEFGKMLRNLDSVEIGGHLAPTDGPEEQGKSLPEQLRQISKNCHYFKPVGNRINQPSYTSVVPPRMGADGSFLASVVANLRGSDPDRFDALLEAFRSIIPTVKRILTGRREIAITERRAIVVNRKEVPFDEERTVPGDELSFQMTSGQTLPMEAMSAGTLLTLAILTQIIPHGGPSVILLDDVEEGLHATAQHKLIKHLRRLQNERRDLQIILSTHSPFIIDEIDPNDVWLLHATTNLGSRARRLSEHPNADRALKVLSAGEFWSAEGEEWITEPPTK